MIRQLSASQISSTLKMNAQSVKTHLAELVGTRLVDVFHEKLPSGREVAVYRIASSARATGFPPRNYEQLSAALITGLVSSLGEKSARTVLYDIGLKVGKKMGESLLDKTGSTTLSMKEYGELVVSGLLEAQRAYPRLLRQRNSELVYEQFNCPFQELADKVPGLICDVLDEAVHSGLDKTLKVKTTRLSCKGHGDPSCRFRVVPTN